MILVARSASPSVQRSQAARLSVALLGECEDLAEAEVNYAGRWSFGVCLSPILSRIEFEQMLPRPPGPASSGTSANHTMASSASAIFTQLTFHVRLPDSPIGVSSGRILDASCNVAAQYYISHRICCGG